MTKRAKAVPAKKTRVTRQKAVPVKKASTDLEQSKAKTHEDMMKTQESDSEGKYGEKQFDVISRAYRQSKEVGDFWCTLNAEKYLERYSRPQSHKANNREDIIKAKVYIERMIENHDETINHKRIDS